MRRDQSLALEVGANDVDGAFQHDVEREHLVTGSVQVVARFDHALFAQSCQFCERGIVEHGRGRIGQLRRKLPVERRVKRARRFLRHADDVSEARSGRLPSTTPPWRPV